MTKTYSPRCVTIAIDSRAQATGRPRPGKLTRGPDPIVEAMDKMMRAGTDLYEKHVYAALLAETKP